MIDLNEIAQELLSGVDRRSQRFGEIDLLKKTVVLVHAHCFHSTIALFEAFQNLGIHARNLIFVPKAYSTVAEAQNLLAERGINIVEQDIFKTPLEYDRKASESLEIGCELAHEKLQANGVKRVLLCDDGGLLSERWHKLFGTEPNLKPISIQQTTAGMRRKKHLSPMAKIDVSCSPAKQFFESTIISSSIQRKIKSLGLTDHKPRIGVIGIGAIGSRLAKALVHQGFRVTTYDRNSMRVVDGATATKHPCELLARTSLVFGCTGQNWMKELSWLRGLKHSVTFVSCSSRAVEFQSLLERSNRKHRGVPFEDIKYRFENTSHLILNGGFPINFDRTREWEPFREILLTRALVLLAVLQSSAMETSDIRIHPLDMRGQALILHRWLRDVELSMAHFDLPDNVTHYFEAFDNIDG